jgi:hypothetical protein
VALEHRGKVMLAVQVVLQLVFHQVAPAVAVQVQ